MRHIVATVLTAVVVTAASAQQQPTTITTHHVTGNIYMFEGQGGNIGVSAGEDGVLIIDDQYDRMSDAISKAIADLNSGDLKFILNTHFHADHAGSNPILGKRAPIVAHDNVRVRLAAGKDLSDAAVRVGLPVITFAESMSIHFNGEEIKAVHFPRGHTDGDSVIFFTGSNVVHMGDHFFLGRFPFIDLVGGGDVQSYISNVKKVIEQLPADVKIIPGHGALATLDDMKTFVKTLETTVAAIQKNIDLLKDRDAVVKAGLPAEFEGWGAGFVSTQRWIGIVYDSLTR